MRFLRGNWKFGKFKLQYRNYMLPTVASPVTDWTDVPIQKEVRECKHPGTCAEFEERREPKVEKKPDGEWCEHMDAKFTSRDWDICPVKGCHAPRPEPVKSLELVDKIQDYLIRPRTRDVRTNAQDLVDMAREHFKHREP